MIASSKIPLTSNSFRHRRVSSLKVICGDAIDSSCYNKLSMYRSQKGEKVLADVLVTDPPYCLLHRRRANGNLREPKRSATGKSSTDPEIVRFNTVSEYREFSRKWLSNAVRNGLKPHANIVIWSNALGKTPIKEVCRELGYTFIGEYIWAKTANRKLVENSIRNEVQLRVYETALIFQKSRSEAQYGEGEPSVREETSRKASIPWSVITGYHDIAPDGTEASHEHSCHKPFSALEPLLVTWTKPGDLI